MRDWSLVYSLGKPPLDVIGTTMSDFRTIGSSSSAATGQAYQSNGDAKPSAEIGSKAFSANPDGPPPPKSSYRVKLFAGMAKLVKGLPSRFRSARVDNEPLAPPATVRGGTTNDAVPTRPMIDNTKTALPLYARSFDPNRGYGFKFPGAYLNDKNVRALSDLIERPAKVEQTPTDQEILSTLMFGEGLSAPGNVVAAIYKEVELITAVKLFMMDGGTFEASLDANKVGYDGQNNTVTMSCAPSDPDVLTAALREMFGLSNDGLENGVVLGADQSDFLTLIRTDPELQSAVDVFLADGGEINVVPGTAGVSYDLDDSFIDVPQSLLQGDSADLIAELRRILVPTDVDDAATAAVE